MNKDELIYKETWETAYPERVAWDDLPEYRRDEWKRVFEIFKDVMYKHLTK